VFGITLSFDLQSTADVVEHQHTGYLAEPYDPADLTHGIRWVLENPKQQAALGRQARQRAEHLWNPGRIAGLYAELYREVRNGASSPSP